MQSTRRVVDAADSGVDWELYEAGASVVAKYGTPWPEHVQAAMRRNRVALKGEIACPMRGYRNANEAFIRIFELYANLRPAQTYAGLPARNGSINLLVIRDQMEDLYALFEYPPGEQRTRQLRQFVKDTLGKDVGEDAGVSLKPITGSNTRRLARWAMEYARRAGRKKIAIVYKANFMKATEGYFLQVAKEVAAGYPELVCEEFEIDKLCMELTLRPRDFDVLLSTNMFGDILSDLCEGLTGGYSMMPQASFGDDLAFFEPRLQGYGLASMVIAAALMLDYLDETNAAARLESAVAAVLEGGKFTAELCGKETTSLARLDEMTDAIIRFL
jgi:isocitrate dehydrogenase (NAD+)